MRKSNPVFDWGAHAPRVPVAAPRRNELFPNMKFAIAGARLPAREARALPSKT